MATVEKSKNGWSVEIKSGVDKDGNPKYSKKSLPGSLVPDADPNLIQETGNAIIAILDAETRDIVITEVESYLE